MSQQPANQELVPTDIDWRMLADRPDLDAATVQVTTTEIARITSDKYLNRKQRAAMVGHTALFRFAEAAGADTNLVTSAAQLQESYYDPAAYMHGARHSSAEMEVITEMLDEGLAPFRQATPLPIAERLAKRMLHSNEGEIGVLIVKLWAADTYEIDMPAAFEKLRHQHAPAQRGHMTFQRNVGF